MNEFLASLDQWALQVLMVLYHLMGVQDLPSEASSHWKVVERWSAQPDGHYRLVLESETIQEECRSGRARYVIFPQTYMAKQEIYADNIRVYTNEMDKEWHLRSFLERPLVNCDHVNKSEKIIFSILSYNKYFSTINEWPRDISSYPKDEIFYNFSYILVGILSISISIICFIISYYLKEASYHIIFMGVAIFFLMFVHNTGTIFSGRVEFMHQIVFIAIGVIGYITLNESKLKKIKLRWHLLLVMVLFLEFQISNFQRNLIQLFIIANACLVLISIFVKTFYSNDGRSQRIIYFSVLIFGVRDLYLSQAKREGFLNLSLLCLVLVAIIAYRIINKIYSGNIEFAKKEESLRGELKTLEKVLEINFKVKQIIHDIKSPLTSLNFMLQSKVIDGKLIKIPIERLNYLINSSFDESKDFLTGWYSSKVLENCCLNVAKEKSYSGILIKIENRIYDDGLNAFFDPEQIRVCIAELIDNTLKYNNFTESDIRVDLTIQVATEGYVSLSYSDSGVGLLDLTLADIGIAGISSGRGTGMGISLIKSRIEGWGGKLEIQAERKSGFSCLMLLLAK